MIRLMLGFVAAVDRDRRRGRAVGGRARQLSGQHHHDLRQLPFAEGAAGGDRRQGFFRRPALRRAAVRRHRAQHHAGQGNRHRQLDRRADQDAAADRQESATASRSPRSCRRRSIRSSRPAISTPSSPICAAFRRSRTRCPTRSTRSRCRIMCSRAPRRPTREADLNDKLKRGFYLATIGHCMECHTPFAPPGGPRFRELARQGRPRIPRPLGRVEVAQHHLAQDRRHRRLDRRRDQDRDHPGQAEGRHAAQGPDGLSSTTPR